MPLTNTAIQNAKAKDKSYKLTDGDGMFLLIHPNGSKYWRLKYRLNGKEKTFAIGTYPEITLASARERRAAARKLIAEGHDPVEIKREAKRQEQINTENTFINIAKEWHENRKGSWTPKHARNVTRRLEADIFPFIGQRLIHEITAADLLKVLRKIEAREAIDLAHRMQQITGQIFRYAIATGRAERDLTADLRGALKPIKVQHHSYLHAKDLPEYLQNLENYQGDLQTKNALRLLLLTFVRTSELRGAAWHEIDLEKAEWRIPAERMKMREPHIVPLSKQAVAVFKQQLPLSRNKRFVFPGVNPTKCMSENTMLYALYRMGYHSRTTGHGFRATASTILNELGYRSDVIERQLAHAERNKVRASYNHAQHLSERKLLMQGWADYLAGLSCGDKSK